MYLGTGHSVRIRVDAAATTTESIWYVGHKKKIATGLGDLVAARGVTNGTTNVTVVSAIPSGEQAEMVFLELYNADTVSHTYTVEFYTGSAAGPPKTFVLGVGERIEYIRDEWTKRSANGNPSTEEFATRVDEGATYTYVGQSSPGAANTDAVWRIKRITNATTTITFADGNANFDNVWDNRASLTYA
jgi:hypothetical protein